MRSGYSNSESSFQYLSNLCARYAEIAEKLSISTTGSAVVISIVAVAVGVAIAVAIYRTHTGCILVAVIVCHHSGI